VVELLSKIIIYNKKQEVMLRRINYKLASEGSYFKPKSNKIRNIDHLKETNTMPIYMFRGLQHKLISKREELLAQKGELQTNSLSYINVLLKKLTELEPKLIEKNLLSYDSEYDATITLNKLRDFYIKTKDGEKLIPKKEITEADIQLQKIINSGVYNSSEIKLPLPPNLLHIIATEDQFKEHFLDYQIIEEGSINCN